MIEDPTLLLIGSTARNAGKTTLAMQLAKQIDVGLPIGALKATRIADEGGGCPRGEHGCGLCDCFEGGFCLERITSGFGKKDTALLFASGIEHVHWLRARDDALIDGYRAYTREVGGNRLVICESNSLRKFVRPLVFIMLVADSSEIKPSAQAVMEHADIVIPAIHIFEKQASVLRDINRMITERLSARAI